MQGVLWDIIRAETYSGHFITSAGYKKNQIEEDAWLQKQVFAIHGVSWGEFYTSFSYYKTHTELMKSLLDSMINKAGKENNSGLGLTPEMQK